MNDEPFYFEDPNTEYRVGEAIDLLSELLLQGFDLSEEEATAVVVTRDLLSRMLMNSTDEDPRVSA